MAIIVGLAEEGENLGFPPAGMEKRRRVADSAFTSPETMKSAGVKMGLGTDLPGALHPAAMHGVYSVRPGAAGDRHSSSFCLRSQYGVAEQTGRLGCIRKDAVADLLVVDGNPLEDISVLGGSGGGFR